MAQMPRGNPRSVPDPAGDQYDEMLRQERLKQQRDQAAANKLQSAIDEGLNAGLFSPIQDQFRSRDPRLDRTAQIGGQLYREIDNGQANVLVPVDDPKLADQRRAIDRTLFMTGSPLAGVGYGLATLAGASADTREKALAAGGMADAALFSAAPRTVRFPGPPRALPGKMAPRTWSRPGVRERGANASGQGMGFDMTVTTPVLGSGTKADRRILPPGWSGHGTKNNEARGHLRAKDLGGSGKEAPNLVTLTQHPTNTPQMRDFEQAAVRRSRAGEVFEYSVTPFYSEGVLPPMAILMTTFGGRSEPTARLVHNPAGRRKK